MKKFYTAETDANGHVNNNDLWTATDAVNLASAKRIATRRQTFQGTAMHVGEQRADGIVAVAVKRNDPINMNVRVSWVDCE